jgi:hypothetical protein
MMNQDKTQNLFIALLAAGLLVMGTGIYVLSQQVKDLRPSSPTPATQEPAAKDTNTPAVRQRTLTMAEANQSLTELIAMDVGGNWNDKIVASRLVSEPLLVDDTTLHLPYDPKWGNDMYQLDTFDEMESDIYFGPMYVGEFGGAWRPGSVRVTPSRTLDAAMADPTYTSVGCSGEKTFKPAKVKVGNVDTVRYEGEACEATWVGYEIRLPQHNVIISATPTSDEQLIRWVLERM